MITPGLFSTADVPRAVAETNLFRKLTCAFGLLAILSCLAGLIGNIPGIIFLSSVCQGCKTLALSAALIWIFFGSVLIYVSIKPMRRIQGLLLRAVLVVVAGTEAI